jgi:hypothetical protein
MLALVFLAVLISGLGHAKPKVPDIPTGSKVYIENRGTTDEALRASLLLAGRLSKDEGGRNYLKPGYPIVDPRMMLTSPSEFCRSCELVNMFHR